MSNSEQEGWQRAQVDLTNNTRKEKIVEVKILKKQDDQIFYKISYGKNNIFLKMRHISNISAVKLDFEVMPTKKLVNEHLSDKQGDFFGILIDLTEKYIEEKDAGCVIIHSKRSRTNIYKSLIQKYTKSGDFNLISFNTNNLPKIRWKNADWFLLIKKSKDSKKYRAQLKNIWEKTIYSLDKDIEYRN